MEFSKILNFYPVHSLTEHMLNKTRRWNAAENHWIGREVVSRGMGSLGVAGASSIDAIREVIFSVLTAAYTSYHTTYRLGHIAFARNERIQPWNLLTMRLVNIMGRKTLDKDAFSHLRQAGLHVAAAVAALGLGGIAPSELLIPAMMKMGFDVELQGNLLDRISKAASNAISKRAIFVGAGLVGLSLAAHSWGLLSAYKAAEALPAVGFWRPSLIQIGLVMAVANFIAHRLVKDSTYGPVSGCGSLYYSYERAAELLVIGPPACVGNLLITSMRLLIGVALFPIKSTRREGKRLIATATNDLVKSMIYTIPIVGNLAAIYYYHNVSRFDRARLEHDLLFAKTVPCPTEQSNNWLATLEAEQDSRCTPLTNLIKSLAPSPKPDVENDAWNIATLVDDKARLWRVCCDERPTPWALIPHPFVYHGHGLVKNAANEVITKDMGGRVPLTVTESQELRQHLLSHKDVGLLQENFFCLLDTGIKKRGKHPTAAS